MHYEKLVPAFISYHLQAFNLCCQWAIEAAGILDSEAACTCRPGLGEAEGRDLKGSWMSCWLGCNYCISQQSKWVGQWWRVSFNKARFWTPKWKHGYCTLLLPSKPSANFSCGQHWPRNTDVKSEKQKLQFS